MSGPERIWIDDERAIGGSCHVFNDPTEGVVKYCVEYVRADLCHAQAPAPSTEWDDAIEAAAKVAQSADTPVFKDGWTSGQDAAAISAMQSIATAIRALKKGGE